MAAQLELGAGETVEVRHGSRWDWPVLEELYGRSRRSIEKWAGAPLDRPREMAEWWRQNRRHRVPARLLELEAGNGEEAPAAGSERVDLAECEARSVEEMLDQVRRVTAMYYRRLQDALARGDEPAARAAEEGWNRAALRQRQWEKDVTRIQLEQGEALTIAEVRKAAVPRLLKVRRAFEEELERHLGREAARVRVSEMFTALAECEFLPSEEVAA